jgi:hypothetical protein
MLHQARSVQCALGVTLPLDVDKLLASHKNKLENVWKKVFFFLFFLNFFKEQ